MSNNTSGGVLVAIVAVIAIILVSVYALNMLEEEGNDEVLPDSVNIEVPGSDDSDT